MLRRVFIQVGMIAGLGFGAAVQADNLGAQQTSLVKDVVLSVYVAEDGQERNLANLTLDDLKAMPQTSFMTETVWTDGKQEFAGVSLADLAKQLGFSSGMFEAWAINDYLAEIPLSDAQPDGPIIAYLRNGAPMSVRDKGPLWVIYPYDSDIAYQREEIYVRSVWQLNRLIHYP